MNSPRLHPETIEEVQNRADIIEIISDYVVLKKKGRDFLGLCPFHAEKTPSFSVSSTKQLYHCFGCGVGGNAITFLMELGKQSFAEVILDLAQRYQVPIKTIEPEKRQELKRQLSLKEQLYEILAVACNFYRHALTQPEGEIALRYLQQTRKLSSETINSFQLGYAPSGWETLYRYLVEQKRYSVKLVEQAGLIKPRKQGNGYYDVFRDRLIIPILDIRKRVIGFGSRTLKDEKPKYLNSPETILFDKSKTLFALDKAHRSISQKDSAIVVEGYFDAIALHHYDITNSVACLGTALSKNHLRQILKYTQSKQVILNFDADQAGKKATERTISEIENLVYAGQVQLKVLNLSEGKDADEFLQTSDNAINYYRQAIKQAPLWIDWQIEQLVAGKNLKLVKDLQPIAQAMVNLLSKIIDNNLRNHYLQVCAQLLSQGDNRIIPQNLASLKAQITVDNSQIIEKEQIKVSVSPEDYLLAQAESLLLKIYLHLPLYREKIILLLEEKDIVFTSKLYRDLWLQIVTIESKLNNFPDFNNQLLLFCQNQLLESFSQNQSLKSLLYLDEKGKQDLLNPDQQIFHAILMMKKVSYERLKLHYTKKLKTLNFSEHTQEIKALYQTINNTQQKIDKLNKIIVTKK